MGRVVHTTCPTPLSTSTMPWIPDPSSREPLTWDSFMRIFLPPVLCYHVTALLVITPRTFPIRVALLPITIYGAFRCATQLDLAKGFPNEERLVYLSQALIFAMTTLASRATIWTFQHEPYRRLKFGSNSKFFDALDLSFNFRGIGWSWSSGLKLPPEMRNTSSTSAFLLSTLRSILIHLLLLDLFLHVVQSFGFSPFNPTHPVTGTSIFHPSLPPLQRYLLSSFISTVSLYLIHNAFHLAYSVLTVVSVGIFAQSPEQWPPLFFKPWYSTSLNDFWTCRWHQLFRHKFICLGGVPGYLLFGRAGAVMGAFLVSGLLHYFGLWGMGRGTEFLPVAGFFLMMGVGVLLEFAFKAVTGHRVGGFFGWLWCGLWLLAWGNMLVDAWLRKGAAGSLFYPEEYRPSSILLRVLQEHRWLDLGRFGQGLSYKPLL